MRDPLVSGEKTRLPELLQMIRANRTHLVLIQDEYGGLAGVVTLHDLFERIVGHIEDVDDGEELWIQRLDEVSLRVNGRVELWELNEELGVGLDEDVARTVGGFIFNTLGRPAKDGDVVETHGLRLTVKSAEDNRIGEVLVELVPPVATSPAELS
ncbi:CBS domain-containing protein [bacterium]|nr:CBS domain-containing protein [bacterium]